MVKGLSPTIHAESILQGMRVAHARIIPHAHVLNQYTDFGHPEAFNFGISKFVTLEEAKEALIDTFVRLRQITDSSDTHQFIILVGHAAQDMLTHISIAFGLDLLKLRTIVKGVETQNLAKTQLPRPKHQLLASLRLLQLFRFLPGPSYARIYYMKFILHD
ncbi:hypothetical protein SVAN01_06213 [Stagonosporopsis vannaccii]|nr:hypothetical protein SVAN01_06213 [Stagonosporopsis vannaccii]